MAEQTLTGFILEQATKSRKEAKAEKARQDKAVKSGKKVDDKDRKGLFRKAFTKNLFGGLFGGRSATGGSGSSNTATGALLSSRKKKQKQPKGDKPSGGKAKGLEKILLTGFGSLAADTTAISGGLAALTEIMNSQLNVEGDMSSNIQGINAILADQLEVQTQLIGSLGGGLNVSNDQGDNSILPGGEKPKAAKDDSATAALLQRAQDMGAGAVLRSLLPLLFNPGTAAATALGAWSWLANEVTGVNQAAPIYMEQKQKELEGKTSIINPYTDIPSDEYQGPFRNERPTPSAPLPTGILKPASQGLVNYSTGGVNVDSKLINVQNKNQPKLYSNKTVNASSTGGNMLANFISLSTGGIIPTAIPQSSTAYPMAAGGRKAMIGEAGKEAVVPLHSADSPAKSKVGMDPSMQASAGSMLAVTDQFIKSMGPLGGPVSQALGADISNLAKTFGMSQTLPNLSLGGGKFREDTTAKKSREKFLKELIAGSLESLGAKKKEATATTPSTTTNPGDTGTSKQKEEAATRAESTMKSASPSGIKMTKTTSDGKEVEVMESKDKIKGVKIGTTSPDIFGNEQNVVGPGAGYRPVEGTNQQRWYDVDGKLYTWQPGSTIKELTPQQMREGWNGKQFVRKQDTGHVRVMEKDFFIKERDTALGEYSYRAGKMWTKGEDGKPGWLSPPGPYGGMAPSLPPETDIKLQSGGKVVQKPWWDFLGWVTASQEVKKGTTGIYSDSPMGRISEAAAQRNKMMKELGYESGGTMTGVKAAPAPTVAPVSYAPMATPMTESADIGAIVNIVGSQAQQPIPIMPNNEGQSTSDYVAAPMGGGLAFTVLSTSQWGG